MADGATITSAGPVDLAREPDFWLGPLHVRPSICQVVFGGDPIDLQPKIMQVLVALARAQGRAVSREDLLAICWGDVVVGDDSVHRCVARLRRLSMEEAAGVFSIVTQARVGYRLVLNDPPRPEPKIDATTAPPAKPVGARLGFPRRRAVIVSLAATLIVGLIAAVLVFAWPAPPVYRIAVRDFKVEGLGAGMGESLASRVAAAVSDRDLPIVSRTRSSRGDFDGARFIVGGDIQRVGDQIKVNIQLDDVSSGLTLWTDTISRSAAEADALQDQVAGKVADLMDLTRRWLGPHGNAAKPEAVAALFRASDSMRGLSHKILRTREAFRQFRDLDPESSKAHSGYAMATVFASYNQTPDVAARLRAEAASEARRAIALDPKNGEGYTVLGSLTPDDDLAAREAWFMKGLAADPDNQNLPDYLGSLLLGVGRVAEGVSSIDRSVKLDPLSGPKTKSLIEGLAIAGQFADADKLIERSDRLWPDDINLRRRILFKSLLYAAPARAIAALDRFQSADKPLPAERALLWRDFEKARAGELSAKIVEKRLAAVISSADKANKADTATLASLNDDELEAVIAAMASLGDRDDAFRTLDLSRSMQRDLNTSVLFEPATQSLRGDPRFTKVAADLGLVRYWASVKRKPDFCAEQPAAKVCS